MNKIRTSCLNIALSLNLKCNPICTIAIRKAENAKNSTNYPCPNMPFDPLITGGIRRKS